MAGLSCGTRSHTTPNTSFLYISEKSVSFVTTMRLSASESSASFRSLVDTGAAIKATLRSASNRASLLLTFSSSRNRGGVDDDIVMPGKRTRVVERGGDLLPGDRGQESMRYT